MYQICPHCKKTIEEEGDYCPHCHELLSTPVQLVRPLTRKEIMMYIAGYILLAYSVFAGRDLSNFHELRDGLIIYGAVILFSAFWYWIRKKGGVGYPPIDLYE